MDVLSDEFVGVFNQALLPSGVWVGEKEICFERLSDPLMVSELGPIVSGD